MNAKTLIQIPFILTIVTGCSSLPRYAADEVHHSIAAPGYSQEIHAIGIEKETGENGEVIRKAESLSHTIKILGFSRTAVYKGAVVETIED